ARRAIPGSAPQPADLGDDLVQAFPVDESHDVVVDAAVLPHIVDRYDPGMLQGGGRERLPTEALYGSRVRERVEREDLDGDATSKRLVLGLVHHPHSPAPQLPEELVTPQHSGGLDESGARRLGPR